jgi:hypothetical protein
MWSELLLVTVAAAAMPLWLLMALLLLGRGSGIRNAVAFALGAALLRILQGVLFGFVFSGVGTAAEGPHILVSTLLLILGLLLLTLAYRKWRKEEDPDDTPKWMGAVEKLTPVKAFGAGALIMAIAMKHWVFTLSAIAIIEEAQPGLALGIAAFVLFVLLAQSLLIVPIIAYALAPERTGQLLAAVGGWFNRNSRKVSIAVSLLFGAWFLWQGISGFLA